MVEVVRPYTTIAASLGLLLLLYAAYAPPHRIEWVISRLRRLARCARS